MCLFCYIFSLLQFQHIDLYFWLLFLHFADTSFDHIAIVTTHIHIFPNFIKINGSNHTLNLHNTMFLCYIIFITVMRIWLTRYLYEHHLTVHCWQYEIVSVILFMRQFYAFYCVYWPEYCGDLDTLFAHCLVVPLILLYLLLSIIIKCSLSIYMYTYITIIYLDAV